MITTLVLALIGAVVLLGCAAILSGNGEDVVLCEDCGTKCDLVAQNVDNQGMGISVYRCPKCGKVYKLN